jgi:hypothetical protein
LGRSRKRDTGEQKERSQTNQAHGQGNSRRGFSTR